VDGFYLPCPHTLLPCTYLLPYPSSTDEKSNLIPVPDGFEYPCPIPIPAVDHFLNKNKSIFQPRVQCCNTLSSKETMAIDSYNDEKEKGRECEIWKEKRENYDT